MQAQNFRFGSSVFVQWEDSGYIDGWRRGVEVDLGTIESCGYVAACGEAGITLTTSIDFHSRACVSPISIPWRAITNIQEVHETKQANAGSNEHATATEVGTI